MAALAGFFNTRIVNGQTVDPQWIAKKMQKKTAPANKTKPGKDYPVTDVQNSDSQTLSEQSQQ